MEGDAVSVAGVGGEVDGDVLDARGGVVDQSDGCEGVVVFPDADLEHVVGVGLSEEHVELEGVDFDVVVDGGHGIDASVAEHEAVVAAVRVVTSEDDLRPVDVRSGHILVHEFPAVGFHAGDGGGAGGVGVEGLGVAQDGRRARSLRIHHTQRDVVEEVEALAHVLFLGVGVAEGDVTARSAVGAEVHHYRIDGGVEVVNRFNEFKTLRIGQITDHTHLHLLEVIRLFDIQLHRQVLKSDVVAKLRHGKHRQRVYPQRVVATMRVGSPLLHPRTSLFAAGVGLVLRHHRPSGGLDTNRNIGIRRCAHGIRLKPLRHVHLRGGDSREAVVLAGNGIIVDGIQVEVLRRSVGTRHGGRSSRCLIHRCGGPTVEGPARAGNSRSRQLHRNTFQRHHLAVARAFIEIDPWRQRLELARLTPGTNLSFIAKSTHLDTVIYCARGQTGKGKRHGVSGDKVAFVVEETYLPLILTGLHRPTQCGTRCGIIKASKVAWSGTRNF